MMTSNIAESLNRAMGKARRLPVTASHEFLRSMTMQWFASRREAARRLKTTVTTSAVRHCDQFEEEVSNCNIRAIDEGRRYQVTHGDDAMVVDFVTNTCQCKRWELDRLPCLHAIAAARIMKIHPHTLCHPYFTKEWLKCAYELPVNPVPRKSSWGVASMVVQPPEVRRQAGRPKTQCLPSRGERVCRKKCGRCGETGHTRLRCSNPPMSSTGPATVGDGEAAGSGRVTRVLHCSFCQEAGHTIRRCPLKDSQAQDSDGIDFQGQDSNGIDSDGRDSSESVNF